MNPKEYFNCNNYILTAGSPEAYPCCSASSCSPFTPENSLYSLPRAPPRSIPN